MLEVYVMFELNVCDSSLYKSSTKFVCVCDPSTIFFFFCFTGSRNGVVEETY